MNIKDVAQRAGVSIATVSNTLNGRKRVSEEKRKAVLAAAEELGYIPNINARLMKGMHTDNLGLFIPYIEGPFYQALMSAVYYACQSAGYALYIHVEDATDTKRAVSSILSCNIDGAIVLNDHLHDDEIAAIRQRGLPMVFLDRQISDTNIGSVILDNEKGTARQVEYLFHTGHRRIAYMRGQFNYDGDTRFRVFTDMMRRLNLPIDDRLIRNGSFNADDAYSETRAMCRSLSVLPDAMIFADDVMALGALRAFRELGIEVPGDISIIGFDDLGGMDKIVPPLTTIGYSMKDYALTAVTELMRLIGDHDGGGRIRMIDTELIVRDSVKIRYGETL